MATCVRALVEATRRLIEERGPFGFTSPRRRGRPASRAAAPYRHFRGRDELVEEVASRGFAMFADKLQAVERRAALGAVGVRRRSGALYLDFARTSPGYYIAMFESGVPTT